jgi:hypothetical protein
MKTLWKLLITAAPLLLVLCKTDQSDTRSSFPMTLRIDNKTLDYTIHCDDDCDTCKATSLKGVAAKVLAKNEFQDVYKKCESLPRSTDRDTSDVGNKVTVDLVRFSPAPGSANVYGFDDWHTSETKSPEESYVSLKAGGSTSFIVALALDTSASKAFDSTILELSTGPVSFDSIERVTTKRIYNGPETIKIFCNHAIPWEGATVEVSVRCCSGINRTNLAGDGYTSEDRLKMVLYNEKKHTNYIYHYLSFKADTLKWRREFDAVLKQGVVSIDTVKFRTLDKIKWDINGNGRLDLAFPGNDVFVSKTDEQYLLVEKTNELDFSYKNLRCASYLIPTVADYNIHFPINQLKNRPDSLTDVWTNMASAPDMLPVGKVFAIGPYMQPASKHYFVEVVSNQEIWVTVCLYENKSKGLPPNPFDIESDTVTGYFFDDNIMGRTLSEKSCAYSIEAANYNTHIHEFLHMLKVGQLMHVDDAEIENIMYYSLGAGNALRYRPLPMRDNFSNYSQWAYLHKPL